MTDNIKHTDRLGTRIANRFRGLGLKEPLPERRGEVWARPVDFSGDEFELKNPIAISSSEPKD